MKIETLEDAIQLAERTGFAIVATADGSGLPHVACARKVVLTGEREMAVTEWFCPGTVKNVEDNPRISLVVWDRAADRGYQLLGGVKRMDNMAMMDGYDKAQEIAPLPQMERKLTIAIESVLAFSQAPHSDEQEDL